MNNLKASLGALAVVALVAGLIFGYLPVTDYETSLSSFGNDVECGSAFNKNDDGLTSFGSSSCEEAGLSRNRGIAISLLVSAAVLGLAALMVRSASPSASSPDRRVGVDIEPRSGSPASSPASLTDRLSDLEAARDSGLLGDEEYVAARRKLLGL